MTWILDVSRTYNVNSNKNVLKFWSPVISIRLTFNTGLLHLQFKLQFLVKSCFRKVFYVPIAIPKINQV